MIEAILMTLTDRAIARLAGVSGWAMLTRYPQECGEYRLWQIGQGYGHIFSAALVKRIEITDEGVDIYLIGGVDDES